jgi:hypothetical protein
MISTTTIDRNQLDQGQVQETLIPRGVIQAEGAQDQEEDLDQSAEKLFATMAFVKLKLASMEDVKQQHIMKILAFKVNRKFYEFFKNFGKI